MQILRSPDRSDIQADLHYYFLLLIAIVLPIPSNMLGNFLIIAMAVNWLIRIVRDGKIVFMGGILDAFIWPVLLFLCCAVSIIYSEDFTHALQAVVSKLHFLFLPLIILSSPFTISKGNYQKIFIAFLSSCIVISLLCVINTFYRNHQEGIPFVYYNSWHFSGENLVARFGIDHIHFAMYFCLCAVLTMHFLFTFKNRYVRAGMVALLLYIVLFIMGLSSRMALITLFLLPCLFIFYWFKRNFLFKILVALHVLAFLIIFGFQFPVVQEKFAVLFKADKEQAGRYQSEGRMAAWKNCLSVINDNWMIGVGMGDLDEELLEKYQDDPAGELSDDKQVKNQYLETAGTTGISGLACLLLILAIPAYKASRKKNFIFLAFLKINALFFIVESMLFTPKGAMFFIYFYCVLSLGMFLKTQHQEANSASPYPEQPAF